MDGRMWFSTKSMMNSITWTFRLEAMDNPMADNHSKEVRSMNMSHIRSTNSKPEEKVRKYLFARGLRYRKMIADFPDVRI